MAITLGDLVLDDPQTVVAETYEEVGGRDARVIRISGLIVGETSVAAIEARLDAVFQAASDGEFTTLSVRDGRQLSVRRSAFARELARESLVGSFTLTLEATDPFELSADWTSHAWNVAQSGDTLAVAANGSVFSKPVITLVAAGSVWNPAFSDGARTIQYAGLVADGQPLVFDAASSTLTLDGADVTPYSIGLFPRIAPEGVTLTYTDDPGSSHTAAVTVAYRDRWW